MGIRANYVVIEDGDTYLAWSRWGGDRVVADLRAGPRAATDAVRPPHPPVVPAPDTAEALLWRGPVRVEELMTDVQCEGAALIDHDRRVLLAFQWVEDYAAFIDGIAALTEAWPGWRVRWAFDGVLDLAAYLGRDREGLRENRLPDASMFAGRPAPFHGPGRLVPDASDTYYEGVLSVRHPDGSLELHLATERPSVVAFTTAAAIAALEPGFRALTRQVFPRWGLHLEPESRTAGLWSIDLFEGALIDPEPNWPGWTWDVWGGDIRRQLDACGGALRVPPLPAALRNLPAVGV
ncbi:hypothetical protein [Dactylosporangium matsuzakiense]|uniref:Uncharacterized protein n=1 Tax=Dactylosporangium matsuzakiense TaxID=53360 RepID=A0A9W6KED5_9ACTN|nr:hypothetical protein [Dactylosporangium matsuzakiense]UWZ47062.1 hypothetical protein Dmats_12060 [Dactylosporangium matsuzakiense]GLK98504.1 hypothetical protein GCM10017581_002450 [Dactylosporangium matsuzakiense]